MSYVAIEAKFFFTEEYPMTLRGRVEQTLRREFADDLEGFTDLEVDLVEWSGHTELEELT